MKEGMGFFWEGGGVRVRVEWIFTPESGQGGVFLWKDIGWNAMRKRMGLW